MKLMNKPFVFMRHGETELNCNRVIGGRTDVPLTAIGKAQARQASLILAHTAWSCIAVSPLLRARQTASLAVVDAPQLIVTDLRERDWGDLELRPLSEQPPYEDTPPNGEPWTNFCARVIHALNELLSHYEQPLIIAHSGIFRVIRQQATGTPYGPRIGNASPIRIVPNNGHWEMHSLEI